MKELAIFVPLKERLIKEIQEQLPHYHIRYLYDMDLDGVDLSSVEIAFGWHPILESLLEKGTLKWIQLWSVGVDKLPLKQLEEAGIILTSARGCNAPNIAQQVLTYLLMTVRKFPEIIENQRLAQWKRPEKLTELKDQTLVFLGTGEIAKEILSLLTPFPQLRLIGINTNGRPIDGFTETHSWTDFKKMLGDGDFVINALPLTKKTEGICHAEFFSHMKQSSHYISVGRGKTTDTDALIEALQQGTIAGAMMDVFAEEPLSSNSPCWQVKNLLITPHSAGFTNYYNERIIQSFLTNYQALKAGKALSQTVVDYQKGY